MKFFIKIKYLAVVVCLIISNSAAQEMGSKLKPENNGSNQIKLAPNVPQLLEPSDNSSGLEQPITFKWQGSPSTDYYIFRILSADSSQLVYLDSSISVDSTTVSGLEDSTAYVWTAAAVNVSGRSDFAPYRYFSTSGLGTLSATPETVDFGITEINSGGTVKLSLINNFDTDSYVSIRFTGGDDSVFSAQPMNGTVSALDTLSVEIDFNPGAERYYESVIEIRGTSDTLKLAVSGTGFIYEPGLNLNYSLESFGDYTKITSFRMISLPGDNSIPLDTLFEGSFNEDWTAFRDNGELTDYLVKYDGSEFFNFEPGRAFWVLSKNGIDFQKEAQAVKLDSNYCFSIEIHPGWNQIANPFAVNVLWEDVKVINGISNPVWAYFGEDSVSAYLQSDTLEPYQGYYYYNSDTSLSRIAVQYTVSSNLYKKEVSSAIEYESGVTAELYIADKKAADVTFGLSAEADDNLDNRDIFSPPSDFLNNNIYLENKDLNTGYKKLDTEYKNSGADGKSFTLVVQTENKENAELRFSGAGFDNGYEHLLIDTRLNREYSISDKRTVGLDGVHRTYRFKYIMGTHEYIVKQTEDLLPEKIELYQNYPNPFNPETVIRFALNERAFVTLKVYSITGELIKVLSEENFNEGYHETVFNGSAAASGVYIYVLETLGLESGRTTTAARKMILLR